MSAGNENPWNSLEVVKLISSSLTPLIVAGVGIYIHRLTKRFEHLQWRNQKLVEKRLSIYDDLASLLNENMCYFTYVGSWKERTPPEVIASKRIIDKKIHLAAPLFSPCFFSTCMKFQNLCFETYTGWGEDAKLRTQFKRRKDAFEEKWDQSWDLAFSDEFDDPSIIRQAYLEIMRCFSEEIGIYDGKPAPTGMVPYNID